MRLVFLAICIPSAAFRFFHSGEHATPPCFLDDPISVSPIPIDRPTPLDLKEWDQHAPI